MTTCIEAFYLVRFPKSLLWTSQVRHLYLLRRRNLLPWWSGDLHSPWGFWYGYSYSGLQGLAILVWGLVPIASKPHKWQVDFCTRECWHEGLYLSCLLWGSNLPLLLYLSSFILVLSSPLLRYQSITIIQSHHSSFLSFLALSCKASKKACTP